MYEPGLEGRGISLEGKEVMQRESSSGGQEEGRQCAAAEDRGLHAGGCSSDTARELSTQLGYSKNFLA